jgi:hypothetical protein
MALQLHFFMAPDDERELLRKLESWKLELYPEFTDPRADGLPVKADTAALLTEPAYYFAVEAPVGYPIKRGQNKGQWKIDEVKSAVVYFLRSEREEHEAHLELRSGYFWVELEMAGDYSRQGGKPDLLRRLWLELQGFLKVRYRKSRPTGFFVGPHAARLHQEGALLREAGRKGELVEPFR